MLEKEDLAGEWLMVPPLKLSSAVCVPLVLLLLMELEKLLPDGASG